MVRNLIRIGTICGVSAICTALSHALGLIQPIDKPQLALLTAAIAAPVFLWLDVLDKRRRGLALRWALFGNPLAKIGILQIVALGIMATIVLFRFRQDGVFGAMILAALTTILVGATVDTLKYFRKDK